MPKIIIAKTMRRNGVILGKGTPLEVGDREARDLTDKGYATRELKAKAPDAKPVTPPAAATVAKPSTAVGATTTADLAQSQQYATRDLKAKS